jgi:hypothetical protein
LLELFDEAVAPDDGPVTFVLDEFLDVRTFESFPGLRHVQDELVARLATSPNRFALASRFTARTHRLSPGRAGGSRSCTCRRSRSAKSWIRAAFDAPVAIGRIGRPVVTASLAAVRPT